MASHSNRHHLQSASSLLHTNTSHDMDDDDNAYLDPFASSASNDHGTFPPPPGLAPPPPPAAASSTSTTAHAGYAPTPPLPPMAQQQLHPYHHSHPADDTEQYLADSLEHEVDMHRQMEKWLPTPVAMTQSNALFQAEHIGSPDDDAYRALLHDDAEDGRGLDEEQGGAGGSSTCDDDDDDDSEADQAATPPWLTTTGFANVWQKLPLALPPNDALWAILFVVCSIVLVFISLALWLTPTPPTHTVALPTPSMLLAIRDAIPVLISTFVLSCILGAFWVLLMGAFVRVIVWATILFIPSACVCLTGWALALLFQHPATSQASLAQAAFLVLVLVTTVVSGTVFALVTYVQRDHIELTIRVLQLATHVLSNNPSIFVLSLGLLCVSLAYIVLWIATVARFISMTSALLGLLPTMPTDPTVVLDSWILGLSWTPTLVFYTAMLVWTTQVISSIHRMALACIVHHWYFSRTTSRLSGTERARRALIRSSTVLLGTACAGALVASALQVARFAHRIYVRHIKQRVQQAWTDHGTTLIVTLGPVAPVLAAVGKALVWAVSPLLAWILGVLQVVNHYAMVYAAITGKSYLVSAKASGRLLARSVSSAVVRDAFAKAVLLLGNAILSGVVGLGIVTAMRADTQDGSGAPVGTDASSLRAVIFVGMWIGWAVMRFWGQVLTHVVDATYLCFAIDVDNKTRHLDEAHGAFERFRY